ncbi:hypothetical protein L207DRAFT_516883 [Hyaloscypha variabilis F]|uniref:Galactose oxidase n=1 Tax=Hyaloscypha variabilis (strain UAMH 11265 / GT02V1 / F) TaxID=1149755 RepID=A0A2J6R886_HYAVF|nr:hypothetical protein L207DRAFT_516883 [Hyaloscypha variabilis F]
MNFTLSIDLSTSWTTSDVVPIVTLHENGDNMLVRDASMFYDPISNMVYWYGGYPYLTGFQPSVWGFTLNGGQVSWEKIYDIGISHATSGSTFPGFTFTTGSLWTSTPTAYYSLGGYIIGGADPAITGLGMTSVSGMVEYNFQEGLWTNTSDTGATGYREQGFSIHGEAIYVPIYGKDGIIVFLGGDIPTTQAYVGGAALAEFSDITIYDISTGNYYQQTATGLAIPLGRIQFCATGAAAADNSSFEIFIYGGSGDGTLNTNDLTADQAVDFGKVYILSLPAFTWIQAPDVSATQRSAHSCRTIGNRQMVSIGGIVNNNSTFTDPWTNGLGIFDMTELTWGFNYDATAAPYVPSKAVTAYYNSSSRYPSSWANSDLKTIFKDTGATTVNGTSSPTGAPAARKTYTGAIVGSVLGGLALIAVLVVCVFFFCMRLGSRREKSRLDNLGSNQPAFYQEGYRDNSYNEMGPSEPKYQLGTETTRLAEMGNEHGGANQPLMKPVELFAGR